jgi:ATP phosphoribosyltransferase
MILNHRLKIAIQKSGRLAEKSISILMKCGLDFDLRKDRLIHECKDFPIDLMMVRDDDIPEYVADGVCHLGIVGENIVEEKYLSDPNKKPNSIQTLMKLGFGSCKLVIAIPEAAKISNVSDLNGCRIATSYPSCLKRFLSLNRVQAQIVELGGSVEIAPNLKIADAICDLVSTGSTLKMNGLKELVPVLESQAVIVRTSKELDLILTQNLERLLQRIKGVIEASHSKYIMMNAPKSALNQIRALIPGMEEPSIMALGIDGDRIAIHAVAREALFWNTIEGLKAVGATSILVLPIEKVVA